MKLKNIFNKTLLLLLVLAVLSVVGVSAADVKFSDDFDNNSAYVAGDTLPNSSTGGKFVFTRNATVEEMDGNNVVKLLKAGNATGRIIYDVIDTWIEDQAAWNIWKESDEEIILSFDFMMKEKNTNFELFNIQNFDYTQKNYGAMGFPVQVESDGDKVYVHGDDKNPIMTGLEIKKWYNAQLIVDFKAEKYSVRIGEYVKDNIPFAVKVPNIMRIFSVTENSEIPLYVDNVEVAVINYEKLDKALYEAKSLTVSSSVGYSDGEYPQSAVTMLRDVVDEVCSEAIKPGADEEALLQKIEKAVSDFKSKAIAENAYGEDVNHIRAELDKAIIVEYSGSTVYNLNDRTYVCNKADLPLDNQEVIWTMAEDKDGVQLSGGELIIESGTSGYVTLMAETMDGIYVKYKVELLPVQPVVINDFSGIEGKITFSGKFNKKNIYPITLRLIGDTIYHREELQLDSDGTFNFLKTVPKETKSQNLQLILDGKDIEAYRSTELYFGAQWKDEATDEFNSADSESIKAVLKKYAAAVGIDKELHGNSSYAEAYETRILKGKSYGDINDVINEVKIANYIIAHKDSGRENIESVIKDNLDLLSDSEIGGKFKKSKFNSLSSSKKAKFYLEALQISINETKDTLEDITAQLNEILTDITESESSSSGGKTSSSSGRGSSGGGGTASYPINPVKKDENMENPTVGNEESVLPFDDIDECEWAKEALMYLKAKNIMVGYENKVRPNDYVTRGEFAKIIVTAFGLTIVQGTASFTDSTDMWWAEFAQIAAENGIVKGFEDGSFGGNNIINREMLATMISRVINAKGIELYDKNEAGFFNDSDRISEYAKEAVEKLYKKGVVNGIGENMFAPELSVTRAQAAQIVYSVLKEM